MMWLLFGQVLEIFEIFGLLFIPTFGHTDREQLSYSIVFLLCYKVSCWC